MPVLRTIGELERGGAITAIQDGNHGAQHPTAREYVAEGVPFIMASDVRDGRILFDDCKRLPRDRTDRLRIGFAKPGDVLLTHKGTVGEVAVVPTVPWDYVMLTPQVTYYRVDETKLNRYFLALAFRSHYFRAQLANQSGQSTRPYIGITAQRNLSVPVFPLPVQQRIASILSAYDDLIENNTRRIAILKEMAGRIYEEWFVRFRFPGHEQVKIVKSELGVIPEGWTLGKLGHFVELAYGKALKVQVRVPGPYPVYGSSGEIGTHERCLVEGPGIIVGRKGNVGSVHWSDTGFFPIDTVYFVRTGVLLHYVYINLQRQNFLNNDAAVPGLNREQAYSLPFVLPSSEVLDAFGQICDPIFSQCRCLRSINANLRATRDLLLSKLISGEIDVSDLTEPEETIAA